jgi:uncharacterized phage-associated protein
MGTTALAYGAGAIANEFLDLAVESKGEHLDAMKLQKLVYFAHGFHLGLKEEPLIDEMVEAWKFGPVIPSLYRQFETFGGDPITSRAQGYEQCDRGKWKFIICKLEQFSGLDHEYVRKLIGKIWDVYGGFTGKQLSNLTHQEKTPWHQIWTQAAADGRGFKGLDIPIPVIQEHFKCLLAK